MAGTIGGSYFTQRYGRKKGVIAMSIWAILTAVLLATSKNKWQMLFARVLNYGVQCLSLASSSLTDSVP